MSTRLCLIGYGKMGKMIGSLADSRDCKVVSTIDPHCPNCHSQISLETIGDADVCIDFSHPSVALNNIHKVIALGKTLVVGTNGWNAHLEDIRHRVEKAGTGLVYGANFSIGMNVFTRIVTEAAKAFDHFDNYDVFGLEMHHNQKADSPSGTAIELSKTILENCSHKASAQFDTVYRRIEPLELHFASIRAGSIPGTHLVGFDSEADTIELTHRVRSRIGFAYGALQASKWIAERKGFFSFSQMISELLC